MNDYWNDPPEMPEPPECCGDIMDVTDDGACVCPKCKKRIEPPKDIDPEAFADVPEVDFGNMLESLGGGGAEHGERNGAQQGGPSSPNIVLSNPESPT